LKHKNNDNAVPYCSSGKSVGMLAILAGAETFKHSDLKGVGDGFKKSESERH
jgi:hypothetical protein